LHHGKQQTNHHEDCQPRCDDHKRYPIPTYRTAIGGPLGFFSFFLGDPDGRPWPGAAELPQACVRSAAGTEECTATFFTHALRKASPSRSLFLFSPCRCPRGKLVGAPGAPTRQSAFGVTGGRLMRIALTLVSRMFHVS